MKTRNPVDRSERPPRVPHQPMKPGTIKLLCLLAGIAVSIALFGIGTLIFTARTQATTIASQNDRLDTLTDTVNDLTDSLARRTPTLDYLKCRDERRIAVSDADGLREDLFDKLVIDAFNQPPGSSPSQTVLDDLAAISKASGDRGPVNKRLHDAVDPSSPDACPAIPVASSTTTTTAKPG